MKPLLSFLAVLFLFFIGASCSNDDDPAPTPTPVVEAPAKPPAAPRKGGRKAKEVAAN